MLERQDLSKSSAGSPRRHLAEYLSHKYQLIETINQPFDEHDEFGHYLERLRWPGWEAPGAANGPRFQAESIRLFREVEARSCRGCSEFSDSAFYLTEFKTLGEKARTSLHDLEHLSIAAEAPRPAGKDLDGKPVDLNRLPGPRRAGDVLVHGLSAMHARVGPAISDCSHLSRDDRLPIRGVSAPTRRSSTPLKTAAAKQITWPCLFDGENGPDGPRMERDDVTGHLPPR